MALRSQKYSLFPADLRAPPASTLGPLLADGSLKRELPTLFISECVFAYMPPQSSNAVAQWFADNFDVVGALLYEMFGLTDNFGKIMKQNLMVSLSPYAFRLRLAPPEILTLSSFVSHSHGVSPYLE